MMYSRPQSHNKWVEMFSFSDEENLSNDAQTGHGSRKNGLDRKVGSTVAEVVSGEKKEKMLALGHSLKDVDAAW